MKKLLFYLFSFTAASLSMNCNNPTAQSTACPKNLYPNDAGECVAPTLENILGDDGCRSGYYRDAKGECRALQLPAPAPVSPPANPCGTGSYPENGKCVPAKLENLLGD